MFQQVIPRSFLWLVTLCVVLAIGVTGCGGDDDDNEWVGTWEIESVDGQSLDQSFAEDFGDISITANDWTFDSDGMMEVEFGMKFEVKEEGLTISGEGSIKMTGTYVLSGSNYTLTPIEAEGTGLFEGETTVFGSDEDTGTWSRSGSTLTLNNDDGSTIVFKKK